MATLIEALEELMGEVEHHDVACADTGGVRIFDEEEWTDTKGVHATCQTLLRVLGEVARGEMTIEALIREIGAPLPTFEVKATRVHTQSRCGEVVYHVQAASEHEARILCRLNRGPSQVPFEDMARPVEVEEVQMEDEMDAEETETIESVEVLQVENESGGSDE